MTTSTGSRLFKDVACPFCGLCCDDLTVECSATRRLKVKANGCALARRGFEKTPPAATPMIGGKPAALDEAVAHAGDILKGCSQPLFGGMATDISGAKAALQLADGIGGVVDHAASRAMFNNLMVLQDGGWMTTTMAEIRNRADLIIFAGTDAVGAYPRFFERCVWPKKAMFAPRPKDREVVYLGKGLDTKPGHSPEGRRPTLIAADMRRMADVMGALRALYNGRQLQTEKVGGTPVSQLADLAARIKKARYGVIVWAAGEIKESHGELTVQAICEFIKDINKTSRFSGFPLGGNDNALGAAQVCTWQSGFPLRTSFATGHPVHDPALYASDRLIESGEADALVWISAFGKNLKPPKGCCDLPTIILGAPGMTFSGQKSGKSGKTPDVYIPVAVPGIDHGGHFVRTDSVTSLPLRQLRETDLPSTAGVLAAIEHHIKAGV